MNPILAIIERELKGYFVSPIAYVALAMWLCLSGYFFSAILFLTKDASLTYQFSNWAVILMITSPFIAMRLLAEEHRQGTLELLLTSPVTDTGVVLGKFLAAVILQAVMIVLTFYAPALLFFYGSPELYPILTGYLGLFFVGAGFLAIGLMASSWTKNQIVAGFVAFAISLLLWILGASASMAGSDSMSAGLINYVAFEPHVSNLARGVIDTSDLLYFVSFIVIPVFIAVRSLETRRWR